MKITLETQKAQIKEELSKLIDEYYEEFATSSADTNFTIDKIEQLMLGQRRKIHEALTESNSKLTSAIETNEKKMP